MGTVFGRHCRRSFASLRRNRRASPLCLLACLLYGTRVFQVSGLGGPPASHTHAQMHMNVSSEADQRDHERRTLSVTGGFAVVGVLLLLLSRVSGLLYYYRHSVITSYIVSSSHYPHHDSLMTDHSPVTAIHDADFGLIRLRRGTSSYSRLHVPTRR